MASNNDKLFTVEKKNVFGKTTKTWVFRTREAQRGFIADKRAASRNAAITYKPGTATWGPER